MSDEIENNRSQLIELTPDIVSAYVSKDAVPVASPRTDRNREFVAFKDRSTGSAQDAALTPAVNPKRSVFPDYIICLEDGRKYKSLKHDLGVHYGLTADEYRQKWGLARDYPMVAPNYAAQRSALAKASGLARKVTAKPAKKAKRKG